MHPAEIISQRKQSDIEKKSYDDLVRERDILSKVCLTLFIYILQMIVHCVIIGSQKS